MQDHRATHKEARVHPQQILPSGQEVVDNQEMVGQQEDSKEDEMRTEEEDKDCKETREATPLMIEDQDQGDHLVELMEISEGIVETPEGMEEDQEQEQVEEDQDSEEDQNPIPSEEMQAML